ncbi:hypothetical protein ACFQ08_19605 [Streptosporangium algeriense]|uniref:Uncharacterized protein n=1 Tax=Streptosporangium algeriense TaxID=1682748 RepID=A0ABW3DSI0_9ACTN
MGDLRSVTLVLAGVSLMASCGAHPPEPSPTASQGPPPSRTAQRNPSPFSPAWKVVRSAELAESSALLDVAAAGPGCTAPQETVICHSFSLDC